MPCPLPACRVAVPDSLGLGRYYLTASYQDRLGRSSAVSMNVSYVLVLPVSLPRQLLAHMPGSPTL